MRIRLITPFFPSKGYPTLTMPAVAGEFSPFADIEYFDENIQEIPIDANCDLVGITTYIFNLPRVFHITKQYQELGVKVMLGGSGATALPDLCTQYADATVIGEVEGLGYKIVQDFKNNCLKKIYQNSGFPDLQDMPVPRYDLVKWDKYLIKSHPIEISRGCPHKCSFCFSTHMFGPYRRKNLDNVMRDVEMRKSDHVLLADLHLTASRTHALAFADRMKYLPGVTWGGEATIASLSDEKFVKKLAASGFTSVLVGIESISADSLKSVNKLQNDPSKYPEIIKLLHDNGIEVSAGFIIGLDGDGPDFFKRSLDFFEKVKISYVTPTFVTYMPGSPEWYDLHNKSRLATYNLEDYDGLHPIVVPAKMSINQMQRGLAWFIENFFSVKSIIKRSMKKPVFTNLNTAWDHTLRNILLGTGYKKIVIKKDKFGSTPMTNRGAYNTILFERIPDLKGVLKILTDNPYMKNEKYIETPSTWKTTFNQELLVKNTNISHPQKEGKTLSFAAR